MPYGLNDYWNDLSRAVENFEKTYVFSTASRDNKEDQDTYLLQKNTVIELIKLWKKLDSALNPGTKIKYGKKMEKLVEDNFGPEQLPPIKGPLSLAFAEQVYLPYMLKHYEKVTFPSIVAISRSFTRELAEKKILMKKRAENLEARIQHFIAANKMGLFSQRSKRSEVKEPMINRVTFSGV